VIQGSCLCGGVRFEVDERQIFLINNCHCVNCRKVSGAAYGTFLQVAGSGFHWISGEELVGTFESSPGNFRAFCRVCGSRAPQSRDRAEHATVPAGSLDGDPGAKPHINMFTASKAPWHTIDNSLPSIPGQESPEFWLTFVERVRRGA
jgi:hypothetical protein